MDLERYRHAEIGAESRFGLVPGNGGSLALGPSRRCPSHLHQVHFHPAYHAAHRTFSLHDEDCSLEAVKMASVGRESDLLGRAQLFSGRVTTHRLKSGVQDTGFRRALTEPTVESDHPRHGEEY
jgi:hypothetical protein